MPLFGKNTYACYYSRSLRLSGWLGRDDRNACLQLDTAASQDALRPSADILRGAAARAGFGYFDPALYILSGFGDDPGIFLYKDRDHLNADGGLFLAPHFIEYMDAGG